MSEPQPRKRTYLEASAEPSAVLRGRCHNGKYQVVGPIALRLCGEQDSIDKRPRWTIMDGDRVIWEGYFVRATKRCRAYFYGPALPPRGKPGRPKKLGKALNERVTPDEAAAVGQLLANMRERTVTVQGEAYEPAEK